MNENIIAYLKEHGKVNINDLAAGLDMTGAEKFPLLVKEISQLESQGELRFDDSGSLALRKKVEKKKKKLRSLVSFVLTKLVLVSCLLMRMKMTCLLGVMTLVML